MKLVVQRVKNASVKVDNKITGSIDHGYLVYLGISNEDTDDLIDKYVRKLVNLRVFSDDEGKLNLNIKQVFGEILLVSQFTLYGDVKKGNRPSFIKAMSGDKALELYESFKEKLSKHVTVKEGIFGADMDVSSVNDGPVTIIIEDL